MLRLAVSRSRVAHAGDSAGARLPQLLHTPLIPLGLSGRHRGTRYRVLYASGFRGQSPGP